MNAQAASSFTLMKAALLTTCRARMAMRLQASCHGVKDWHAGGQINVIGALSEKTLLTVGLFTANINADIFHAWVTQDLLPKLPPACVIVIDNATFHQRQDIKTALANAGRTLEYLPSYSPDFNDIEPKWAQSKVIRKKEECSIVQLFTAYAL